ncbi:hypothetical protein [Lysinibacillus capsici]|uniref:hypothetical protein n=1 Tax=Lysinibacillus capsici TaxID=2115968 RepID=UPI0028A14EB3|nr:hypothetical protein [Lysinibacillus capsici]UNT57921.1 hypothetical protein ICJ70_18755 [Lysinibacillus capsici]
MLEQSKLENVTFYYRKEGIKQLIGQLATVDGLVKFQGTRRFRNTKVSFIYAGCFWKDLVTHMGFRVF